MDFDIDYFGFFKMKSARKIYKLHQFICIDFEINLKNKKKDTASPCGY